jgi:hypothetical protein
MTNLEHKLLEWEERAPPLEPLWKTWLTGAFCIVLIASIYAIAAFGG